jgi:Caspase domain
MPPNASAELSQIRPERAVQNVFALIAPAARRILEYFLRRRRHMANRFVPTILLLSALVISPLGAPGSAHAQNRIALVIGNSAYSNVSALANPANDAADVSQSLQHLGFSVTTLTDAKFDAFRRALIEFGRAARGADMAVLFFAGHGVEIAGDNWLLPVDAEIKNDIDVDTEAVGLKSAMLAVSNAKQLGLVILDACRNNPFAGKMRRAGPAPALDPGLAPVEPGENVLVAYAARDGTTASDGQGRNSPFTTALLRHLETPGLEIEFLFRNVRDDVMSATNDEQQPFVYGSLSSEEIYLKDGPAAQAAYNTAAVMSDAGEIAWSFLKGTSDVDTLQRFVEQFPSSERVADVKLRIASLEKIPDSATPTSGQTYLNSAEFETLTRQTARPFLKNSPAIDAAWTVLKRTKDSSVIRRFTEQFPSRERELAARQRLIEIGENPSIPRDLLLRAATDDDVIRCYHANDPMVPACQRALERYPDIWAYLADFRFRFRLCQALQQLGRCNDLIREAWSRPLFVPPLNRHTAMNHPGESGHRADRHSNGTKNPNGTKNKHGDNSHTRHLASNRNNHNGEQNQHRDSKIKVARDAPNKNASPNKNVSQNTNVSQNKNALQNKSLSQNNNASQNNPAHAGGSAHHH